MRFFKHRQRRKTIAFVKNKKAVLGLPMRLMVSIIIGTVALTTIISFISNPCLFPSKMVVSIEPMVSVINSSHNYTELNITVPKLKEMRDFAISKTTKAIFDDLKKTIPIIDWSDKLDELNKKWCEK